MNKLLAPEGKNKAHEIMMKREGRVKPASTTFRREIIEKQRRANYINEYDREMTKLKVMLIHFLDQVHHI